MNRRGDQEKALCEFEVQWSNLMNFANADPPELVQSQHMWDMKFTLKVLLLAYFF